MSNQLPGTEVGRLLAGAVPPLPAPEDRVGQVRARARRTRQRMVVAAVAGVAAVAVTVVVSVPQLLADNDHTATPMEPADCSTVTEPVFTLAPGELVPGGALGITLCWGDNPPLTLTHGAEEVIDVLNAPVPDEPLFCAGGPGPTLPEPPRADMVVHYPGGNASIMIEPYCEGPPPEGAEVGVRRLSAATESFFELHRIQVIAETDPGSIPTPDCPDRLEPITASSAPADGIERYDYYHPDDPALPSPLVAVAACRYAPDGQGGGELVDSYQDRRDLTGLREILEATVGTADFDHSRCASAVDTMGSALPDVIRVADATGGVREFWVYLPERGAPCPTAFGGPPAADPEPELIDYLGRVLGPAG